MAVEGCRARRTKALVPGTLPPFPDLSSTYPPSSLSGMMMRPEGFGRFPGTAEERWQTRLGFGGNVGWYKELGLRPGARVLFSLAVTRCILTMATVMRGRWRWW